MLLVMVSYYIATAALRRSDRGEAAKCAIEPSDHRAGQGTCLAQGHNSRMPLARAWTFEEQTVPLRLDPNDLVPSTKITSLENTSISPWTYNISRDDSLFPNVLSEANCLLQGCLNLRGQEDLNLQSRPIMHQVLVLRRVKTADAGQGYHYRLESRLVAVGCTCVRPIVHIQH
uniref:Interleukin 17a/f1 n=1 Tax=Nothobranchius furzeri TaxID=105023 RepID=A0A8C6NLW8_NOTFU